MKMTSMKQLSENVTAQLLKSKERRLEALARLCSKQSDAEFANESTHLHNSVGFTPSDAPLLTSIYKFYKKTGKISDKQDAVLKNRLQKYAGQLVRNWIETGVMKKVGTEYVWGDKAKINAVSRNYKNKQQIIAAAKEWINV